MSWEYVFSYPDDLAESFKELVLPLDESPRRCRFCRKTAPDVSFAHEAHVIPHSLGRPMLTSLAECDACNSRGSRLEGDLATALGVHRALSGHPTRKGFPKVLLGKRSHMQWDPIEGKPLVHLDPVDLVDGFPTSPRPYRPMNVCRALARMALFFVHEPELYPRSRAWVRGEEPTVMESPWLLRFEFEKPMPRPFLVIQRKSGANDPWYRTVFGFHTALFAMCVGEPEWVELAADDLVDGLATPAARESIPPMGRGTKSRCQSEDLTTDAYPISIGAFPHGTE